MSTYPVPDYHSIYAIVLITITITAADNTWGFGKTTWTNLGVVKTDLWLH